MAIKRLSVNPFPYVMPALIYEVRNSIKIFHTDVLPRLEALLRLSCKRLNELKTSISRPSMSDISLTTIKVCIETLFNERKEI